MSANVSGPSVSLWAFGRQLSGSELHNGPAAAHNADVNVQLERCNCVPPYLELWLCGLSAGWEPVHSSSPGLSAGISRLKKKRTCKAM